MKHALLQKKDGQLFLLREGKTCNCPFSPISVQSTPKKIMFKGMVQETLINEEKIRQCGSHCPHFDFNHLTEFIDTKADGKEEKVYKPAVSLTCGSLTCVIEITEPKILTHEDLKKEAEEKSKQEKNNPAGPKLLI
jgi:hypothetical protein